MFNIFNHQGNANQNYIEIPSHSSQNATTEKANNNKCQGSCLGEEPLYTVGGNVTCAATVEIRMEFPQEN
jgi:hypothetical protein